MDSEIIIISCKNSRERNGDARLSLFRFHPNLVVPIDEDGTKNT